MSRKMSADEMALSGMHPDTGWAARCLRWHLEQIAVLGKDPQAGDRSEPT